MPEVGLRRSPFVAFALGAAAIVLASRVVIASQAFTHRPELGTAAVTLDLTLTVTALFWMTMVRGRVAPPVAALAVFLVGLSVATALLPPEERGLPARLAWLVAPLEILIVGRVALAARRVARLLARADATIPFEDAFRAAAREALGHFRLADVLAAEAAFVYMSMLAWRARAHVPVGATPFTVHQRPGFGAVVAAIALAGVGETIGLHLLVARASPKAAWILTALSVYSVVWLVGEWRAQRLRPVLLRADALEVRIGLRWRGTVALASVRAVCLGPDAGRHPGAMVASPLGPPNIYLHLAGEAELIGLFGRRRRCTCLGLRVDEPDALAAALRRYGVGAREGGPGPARDG